MKQHRDLLLKNMLNIFLNVLFPNHCNICGVLLNANSRAPLTVCIECIQKRLPYIHRDNYALCNVCGRILVSGKICQCASQTQQFDRVKSMLYYSESVIDLIIAMKFLHRHSICKDFGNLLAHYYKDYILSYDIIIPVPLGRLRVKERGYNQTLLISNVISYQLGIPILDKCVYRKRETRALSGIQSAKLRAKVIKNAFALNNKVTNKLHNKNILIIDDVFTTGATVNEMASAIKLNIDIASIGVLTVARVY